MCRRFGFRHLLTVCLLVTFTTALDPEIESKINDFANHLLTCREIVGLNIAVVQDDALVFKNGYGVQDLDTSTPVTDKTIFGIASLTKAFTATLLGQVLKDNGYSWSTKVRDVLGSDFYFHDGLRTSQATMRDLGSHTLGILNHNKARFEGLSRRDAAFKLRFFEPTSPFRNSHNYNNAMYGLMAYITETISGKSWEDTLKEYIFDPAGMSSTTFSHFINQSRQDIARPYLTDFDTHEQRQMSLAFHSFWGKSGGSGSIMSNTEDMAQWLRLQLANGQVGGEEVISEDVIEETKANINRIVQSSGYDAYKKPNIPVTYAQTGYGLGWRLGWYRGLRMHLHTGTSWGYGALLTLLPDMNIGIYTGVTGADDGYLGRRMLQMYVMDLLLGEEPWLNQTTACSFPEPWTPTRTKTAKKTDGQPAVVTDSEQYVGTYGNFQYGNVTFAVDDSSRLVLQYGDFGRWNLIETGTENEFSGLGADLMWAEFVNSIKFSDKDGSQFQTVTIDFERTAPAIFSRGLMMSEAYPPPDPEGCGSDPLPQQPGDSAATTAVKPFLLFLTLLVSILRIY